MGPWDLGRWYRPLADRERDWLRGADRHRDAAPQRAIHLGRGIASLTVICASSLPVPWPQVALPPGQYESIGRPPVNASVARSRTGVTASCRGTNAMRPYVTDRHCNGFHR